MRDLPETRYVSVGGAEIAYQVVGDGPSDLVFHHGMCHVDLQWDIPQEAAFNRKLASFSRLILFDRRGTGASDRGSSPRLPTWEEWSADLVGVLDAVGSERPAIFAEAQAGPTAMLFAAIHPDRVKALVLGNTTARYMASDDYPIGLPPDVVDLVGAGIREGWGTPEVVNWAMPSLVGDDVAVQALCRLMRGAATPRAAAEQFLHVLRDVDVRDALPLISAPTLILYRQNQTPIEHSRYLLDRIEGARLVELSGGGDEFFFCSDGDRVVEEVAEFVTGARPAATSERVLATMLFTDIVQSTKLAAESGDSKWRNVLDAHDEIVREQLRLHAGREVNSTGDGFLAVFDGPGRAIRCAQAIIDRVQRVGLEIRAGLHTGECESRNGDLAGLAVHIAARVGAVAAAGEVLVSSTVKELVVGSGLDFIDRGEHELKGVPDSWRLFAVKA